MPSVKIELTARMAELLQAGVISITADLYSSGTEVYGRVVQPHPRLGVYPHHSSSLEELEGLLEGVNTDNHKVVPSSSSVGSPTPKKRGTAVKVRTATIPDIGLVPVSLNINGVENSLPKSSLCWRDLTHLSDDQLNRRIYSIGREIGADKAVSRVITNPKLNSTHATTLHKWWMAADSDQRLTLISSSKQMGKEPLATEKDTLLARLGAGQYPFRGTDRTLEEEEDENEEEDDEVFEGLNRELEGLEIDFADD